MMEYFKVYKPVGEGSAVGLCSTVEPVLIASVYLRIVFR